MNPKELLHIFMTGWDNMNADNPYEEGSAEYESFKRGQNAAWCDMMESDDWQSS